MLGRLTGRFSRLAHTLVALGVAFSLSACGGSSPAAPPPPPSSPPPPSTVNPTLSVSDASVREGDMGTSTLTFTVVASATVTSGQTVADASVDFETVAGSATEGVDYTAAIGSLLIPGTVDQVTIDIEVLGDTDIEPDETFTVNLSAPVNATIATATATGTIADDDAATAAFGLDARPDNRTCVAPDRPTGNASVSIVEPYSSLPDLNQPVKLLLEPGSEDRWFVLQKSGQVVTFPTNNPTSVTEYLDLTGTRTISTCGECGLLGMAFHPDYPATREIFLSYNVEPNNRTILSRMVLDDVDNPGAGTIEQVILEVEQDFTNHNGGDIAFGPDGFLYFGLGDGGSGNDPRARSQDTTRLLGSMLRIDVIGTGAGYNIPPTNRFAGNPPCGPGANANDCPEIYAWGLRNPWRWSFDEPTGQLWLADVGQNAREEVNIIERNGNYGWRCREGTSDTGNASDCGAGDGLIDPVTEYQHGPDTGNSITGGFVYRGSAIPELQGLYVFADFASGRFWAARPDGQGGYDNDELIDTGLNPSAFGVGPDNELYFLSFGGSVRRIDPPATPTPDTIPDALSASGCVDPGDVTRPYAGLLPYDMNAPFWSDGAEKERYIGLPNGTTMSIGADRDFDFPNGTVIVKNFRLNGTLIETRHLMRHPDGVWAGYTYEWNDTQTEATRVRGGKVVNISGQEWIYPSEGACLECHTQAAGVALGPEIAQFNKDVTYPSTGRTANQLETIDHVMMFSGPLPGTVDTLDALAEPEDSGASDADRARAVLHTNCSQCHRPNGPTPSDLDLRYTTALADTNACNVTPAGVDLDIANVRLIAPGDADRSMIVARMERRDVHGMPPLGSSVIDTAGVARVRAWINGLAISDCN
jgi:uncharacterized repeat protein (TIGR03806 family)